MRILWNSDVAQQIIRRMNDASQGMGDCLMDAKIAAGALNEANEGGESETLNRLTAQFAALTKRLQAAQQELNDLIADVRSTDQRFEDVEEQISAMIEGMGSGAETPQHSGASGTRLIGMTIDRARLMPLMRETAGRYTPDWLLKLAEEPSHFLI